MLLKSPSLILVLAHVGSLPACSTMDPSDTADPDLAQAQAGSGPAGPGHVNTPAACGCVAGTVSLTDVAGSGGSWRLRLQPCATFHYERCHFCEESGACSQDLADCGEMIHGQEVIHAIEHPDVKMALAEEPLLYGRDESPVDGPVLELETSDGKLRLGLPCREEASECLPIPPGVQSAVDLLLALSEQERARVGAQCSGR